MKWILFCAFIVGGLSSALHAVPVSYLQSRNTLQSGTTAYPSFLYVGSSATVHGNANIRGNLGINGNLNQPLTVSSSMTFTSGTILQASTITFSPTTAGIKGTNTNDNADGGFVGEYIQSAVAADLNSSGSQQWQDTTSISLTAGDWDVTGMLSWDIGGTPATWQEAHIGISTTTGNSSIGLTPGVNSLMFEFASSAVTPVRVPMIIPSFRMSLTTTTTVYLKQQARFSASVPRTRNGRLSARRVR